MPDMPAAPAAAPAPAPAAPAPSPSPTPAPSPAPAAAPSPAPAAPPPASPAPAAAPALGGAPAAAAPYDPKTAPAPPRPNDYEDNAEGIFKFNTDRANWSQAHPEEDAQLRDAKQAAEAAEDGAAQPAADAITEAVKKAEGEEAAKPTAKDAAAAPATPAAIEQWTATAPELKAVFEKYPEVRDGIMQTARDLEAAKPVLEIVGTPDEARFAVEHAQRLVSLQSNWIQSADDPEMVEGAWNQTVEIFKVRDEKGAEILAADGKPKLGEDFKPFVRKAAATAMQDYQAASEAQVATLEGRLKGSYPSEEARAADATELENAQYEKAAFDFILARLASPEDAGGIKLPPLGPNATAEQVATQEALKAQLADLEAKQGRQTTETRRTAAKALDREVQTSYETQVNDLIAAEVAAMKGRNEYVSDLVLNDKWINPSTGQPTKVSDFGARVYQEVNAKISGNPLHMAKLASLQALGAAGKEARIAEVNRLVNLYFYGNKGLHIEGAFEKHRWRLQAGTPAKAANPATGNVARVEPQSAGTISPQGTMDAAQTRTWAEAEAAKDPNFATMDPRTREQMIIALGARKRFGG